MKELITVKADRDKYDILLHTKELDGLPNPKCDDVLERLRNNIVAYQRLRQAREEVEAAERSMTAIKSEATGHHSFDDDIPF